MTQLLDKPIEQQFIHTGISWQNFKAIQQGFADSPGVRLFYYQGELEILSTSPEHEIVKGNLGFLLEDYLLTLGLEFVATGSFSLEKAEVASAQADESYCFPAAKPLPDLAIEVVITSGGTDKLRRYHALGVQEVWFWEAGTSSQLRAISQQPRANLLRESISNGWLNVPRSPPDPRQPKPSGKSWVRCLHG